MNMQKFNLGLIEEYVRTQYGDYGGLIQIDGHNGSDLFKLCEDHGMDMEKYFLIGLSFAEHTIKAIGLNGALNCTALVLDRSVYGQSFDEISEYLRQSSEKVKAKRFYFEMDHKSLNKYIKRFDLMVTTPLSNYINELDIEEM